MNRKVISILHLVILLLLIYWNYYSNTGIIEGNTVGSISDEIDSLFTPAGYAFSIWGLIYLGLITLAIHMIYAAFKPSESDEFVIKAGPPLIAAHLGNALWLWFWLSESSGLSVLVMLFILGALVYTVTRLDMQLQDPPFKYIALVWWPIDLYVGWISVATIANVAAHLNTTGWNAGLSEASWTIFAIALATVLSLFMIFRRNMREFGAVVLWAVIAIAVRHWDTIPSIQWAAFSSSIIIGVCILTHAYINRKTLPLV